MNLIASLKSTAEFVAAATGADLEAPQPDGKSLLMAALSNTDLASRYASTQWLLDQGAVLGAPNSEGYTELHVLFGAVKHDIMRDLRIAEQLIEIGADVNAVSPRGGLVFCEVLRMKYFDEDLEPLYDLWFSQPVRLDFETPSKHGTTPLTLAKAVPYRASILERMESYLAQHA
ncbi:MAG: ankyrin repeat domain-containing protein [Actinobacteria bacterium]|nr:ankyrin repeat domain-containing protein [Actinomycetota bacterium]